MIAYRLTGSRCRCATCGERFNSVSVFDRHRVGPWTDRGAHRRCLETAEMSGKGWQRNLAGFWTERRRRDKPRGGSDQSLPCAPIPARIGKASCHAVA